jgi:RNA polymerase sigma factor (sigma-70 family)
MTNEEFEHLIDQLKNKFYRFAFSILKNEENAKDTVQEVVLKLWNRRSELDKTKNTESFCMNAIKHQALDELRKQNRKIKFINDADSKQFHEDKTESHDLLEKLQKELKNLTVQQRMAVELKDFQGYDYEEISEMLDLSVNAIRAHVSRGRKRLYEIFKDEIDER